MEDEVKELKTLLDNAYEWIYHILNRLDQLEDPGMEPRWPEPGEHK